MSFLKKQLKEIVTLINDDLTAINTPDAVLDILEQIYGCLEQLAQKVTELEKK